MVFIFGWLDRAGCKEMFSERFSQIIINKKRFKKTLIKRKDSHKLSQIKISAYTSKFSIGGLIGVHLSSIVN